LYSVCFVYVVVLRHTLRYQIPRGSVKPWSSGKLRLPTTKEKYALSIDSSYSLLPMGLFEDWATGLATRYIHSPGCCTLSGYICSLPSTYCSTRCGCWLWCYLYSGSVVPEEAYQGAASEATFQYSTTALTAPRTGCSVLLVNTTTKRRQE
jgi:hypothetical protein